ncbi:MAG: hypothetical protein DI534_08140 [Leifsonia xyli]|nr:MAG: hypothetical protein DI534_08140 [Leifsonia xyli]
MTRRMRLRAALAAALAAAVLLAGCAGIPTSGAVGNAPIDLGSGGGDIVTRAEGPQKGATPLQLLAGFLIAQRDTQGNYSIAREYLSDGLRTDWSPTERVLVSDTPVVPKSIDDDTLTVDVNVSAVVGPTGNYTALARSEPQSLVYDFERNTAGEWRISNAPAGLLLSSAPFNLSFAPYPLYFFDPSGAFLVPDVRWFPHTTSRPDRIVKELLAGPSPWYAGGVLVTAFPTGTQLDGGVTITQGTASVDLAGDIANQDQGTRWRMQQQLVASLVALSEVSSVQLTVGGFPVDVGDGQAAERQLFVRPDPLGLAAGGFGYLNGTNVDRIAGISSRVEAMGAVGATLARDGQRAAVRTAAGAWLVSASGGEPLRVDTRAGLVDPSIDVQGFVWSAMASDPDSVIAFDTSQKPHPLPSLNLDGTLLALKVSRDGSRLLVATQGAGGPALTVAGILRDGSGVPTGFGEPLSIAVGAGTMIDASWVDGSTVAVLSGDASGSDIDLYRIGGTHESLGSVPGGVQLVGGNLADGIRVRDGDGTVWRRNSSGGWQSTGIVASFLGTQQ